MELEPVVRFILWFNLTCQTFRDLAFSPPSAEPCFMCLTLLHEPGSFNHTQKKCISSIMIRTVNASPDVNNFHCETCFVHDDRTQSD